MGTLQDLLGISTSPINVPSSFGTLLCAPMQSLLFAQVAGVPFSIPIPGNCSLVGISLRAQGAGRDTFGTVALTNALDITLGTH